MYYQRPLFEVVLQNERSWGFCSTQFVPVLVPPFDKAACLRAYEFIVGRLRRECFPVSIGKIPDGCF